jgi:hypothetical protein
LTVFTEQAFPEYSHTTSANLARARAELRELQDRANEGSADTTPSP